jgi:hypothetical protein
MVRHACGYALANAGHDTRALQDWLGHRSIQHTVRYTELSPTRFKDFWRDASYIERAEARLGATRRPQEAQALFALLDERVEYSGKSLSFSGIRVDFL